jgi:hypothetical protein
MITKPLQIRFSCLNKILLFFLTAWVVTPKGLAAQQPAPAATSDLELGMTRTSYQELSNPAVSEIKPRSGFVALPLISYTPETELGLGGFGVHFFRLGDDPASSRTSSVALIGLYSTRDQLIFEVIPELYWNSEKWHIWSKLSYRLYPDRFWGVGDDTPESAKENYTENSPRLQFWLRRLLYSAFYIEGRLDAQYLAVQDTSAQGVLAAKSVLGADGGRTVGFGLTAGWDSRDQALEPRRGALYELSSMAWQRVFGSDYNFWEIALNLRQFIPIGRTHVLAVQLYGQFQGGEVPFYKMALIGGQRLLRGYYEGRYRDKQMIAAQAEYRLPVWWRFGAVLFAAVGDVSDRLDNFSLDHLKWAVGGGGRVLINSDERLNLRLDLAVGHTTWGIYIGIAEAF